MKILNFILEIIGEIFIVISSITLYVAFTSGTLNGLVLGTIFMIIGVFSRSISKLEELRLIRFKKGLF